MPSLTGLINLLKNDIFIFITIFVVIIIIWLGLWFWIDINVVASGEAQTDSAVRAEFGDKFGAVNALFSGFAFSGIICTLLLQRRDLNETRYAMSHERFDNTFFQLLSLHNDITSKITARGRTGLEAFEAFNTHFIGSDNDFPVFLALQKISRDDVRTIIDNKIIDRTTYPEFSDADITNLTESLNKGVGAFQNFLDDSLIMHEKKVRAAYIKSSSQYIDYFSHYFRNLYHIFKFINETEHIPEEEKIRYSKFVRSQLSDVELVSLFYNSIIEIKLPNRDNMELGYPKMRILLKKFDVLQNINPLSIVHPTHKNIFDSNGD